MADQFDSMIGQVIDRFKIVALLGRGGMGAVYLALHVAAAHVKCVIKTMLPQLSRNPIAVARFQIETDAVTRVRHPNIVRLENFGALDDGQLFMRFEFIEGVPLDRFLDGYGGRLSLHKIIYLALQVCDALGYAHGVGVVHRDLKPDNLMIVVDPAERVPVLVKVVDFGISKIIRLGEVHTGTGTSMGTPYYMSVEQYADAAAASAKSDTFSLGVIIWFGLTGELPWGKPDPGVLYHLQRTVVPTPPPVSLMPAPIAAILLRCLSPNPDDRPTMRELAITLSSALEATEREPSGADVLLHLVRRWAAGAPNDATTLRHASRSASVGPVNVAAMIWPEIVNAGVEPEASGLPPLNVVTIPPAPAASSPATTPPTPMLLPHAKAPLGPRALALAAVSSAPQERAGAAAPVRQERHLPAIMPTGLASGEFTAPPHPYERVPPIMAASEIVLPAGTPDPQSFAYAELPSIVVSTEISQVSRATPQTAPPDARGGRGKLVLLGALVCALAAAATFAAAHLGSGSKPNSLAGDGSQHVRMASRGSEDSPSTTRSEREGGTTRGSSFAGTSTGAVIDAGSAPASQAMTAVVPVRAVEQPDAGAIAASAPSKPLITASTAHAGSASPPTYADKRPTTAAPETSRPAVPRPAPAQKTLRARQLEAQTTGARTGNLHLLVTPWAVCWVDGERVDQTPCILDGLPVGRYRVRLENRVAHKDETLAVTVSSGETKTIERTW